MKPAENVETNRLTKALKAVPIDIPWAERIAAELNDDNAEERGSELWHSMCGPTMDDRPLYWARLWIQNRARSLGTSEGALDRFATASRGTDFEFAADIDRRVIVTGFDPFHLDLDITQSNPSGIVALRLGDTVRRINGMTVAYKTSIVPVRFRDFDQGYIEALLTQPMKERSFDLLITVSMGREQFDLERFPGRRRSAAQPDNEGRFTGATDESPLIPELVGEPLSGPEFLEYTLPDEIMRAPGPFSVNINNKVQTLEQGLFAPGRLSDLDGHTAVSGSGGGYLSNEISYRTLRLARLFEVTAPVGHIHTPRLVGYDRALLESVVEQTERLIESAAV